MHYEIRNQKLSYVIHNAVFARRFLHFRVQMPRGSVVCRNTPIISSRPLTPSLHGKEGETMRRELPSLVRRGWGGWGLLNENPYGISWLLFMCGGWSGILIKTSRCRNGHLLVFRY